MRSQTDWRYVACAMLFGTGLMIGTPAARAETAVSIQYDFVSRPAWLRDELPSGEGATLKFLAIKAIDDRADAVILPFEPYMLLSAEHAEGSLVTNIEYALLPNETPPSMKGHYFDEMNNP